MYRQISPGDMMFIHETYDVSYEQSFSKYLAFAQERLADGVTVSITSINHTMKCTKTYMISNADTPRSTVYEINKRVIAALKASEGKKLPAYMCEDGKEEFAEWLVTPRAVAYFSKFLTVDEATKYMEPTCECVCGARHHLQPCDRCGLVNYCSADCRQRDELRHAKLCEQVARDDNVA